MDQLTTEWEKLDNKVRFILEIIKGTLVVSNRKKVDILKDLKDKKYRPIMKSKNAGGDEDAGDGGAEDVVISLSDHGYDYLLSMQLWSLTMEKVGFWLRTVFSL